MKRIARKFNRRVLFAFALGSVGISLAVLSFAANPASEWAIVSSPSTSTTQANYLNHVTCTSASDCWAVGTHAPYTDNVYQTYQTLIEHWDGTSWSIVASPNAGNYNNFLNRVTCNSASDCWAVGSFGYQTLIEHWDGISWSIVPSPDANASWYSLLVDITCASASDCWAVGYYDDDGGSRTLIERWNGTSWSIVPSPNASTNSNFLTGVTCTSASGCWAVGNYSYFSNGDLYQTTLIEQWNGTSWSIVASPNAAKFNDLQDVTCASASKCWAVGYYGGTGGYYQTLIEEWNGSSWVIVNSPNTSTTQSDSLYDVACESTSRCWAVGYTYDPAPAPGNFSTFISQWDGNSWSIVNSPSATAADQRLYGVTCASESECWAVGHYYNDSGVPQTLIEHYTLPPTPTSVVSRKTHGLAGTFDIDLPLTGNPGIECRGGGSNNDYQIVFTFPSAVTFNSAAVTSGTGTVPSSSGNGTTEVAVNLTGVSNAQTTTVSLLGVSDGANTNNVGVQMAVLAGDTTGDRFVNSADIGQTKTQSGNAATNSNFREDLNADGVVNSADISLVKSKSGTALP